MHASATIYLEVRYCSVINYSLWWHGSTACRLWNVNNTMQNVATYLSVKLTSRCGPLTLRTAGKSIQYCLRPVVIPCFKGNSSMREWASFEWVWGREGEWKREGQRLCGRERRASLGIPVTSGSLLFPHAENGLHFFGTAMTLIYIIIVITQTPIQVV